MYEIRVSKSFLAASGRARHLSPPNEQALPAREEHIGSIGGGEFREKLSNFSRLHMNMIYACVINHSMVLHTGVSFV